MNRNDCDLINDLFAASSRDLTTGPINSNKPYLLTIIPEEYCVMKTIIRLMVISMLMFLAAPAWSNEVRHVYHCVQEDETNDDALAEIASEWVAAARKMKGGENIQVYVHFPVAADVGDVDFLFVVVAPSFEEMGIFLQAYDGSPLEGIDDRFDQLASCPNSALWESITID